MVKWGVIGSGQIANKFAADFSFVKNAKLCGVTSQSYVNAQKMASKFQIHAFPSVEDLLNEDLDVIYIATPHPFHKNHSIAALRSGKAVLCEKPFTINQSEAETVVRMAQEKNLFLMEAMWSRFIPANRQILNLVREDAIGQVQRIEAGFGYDFPYSPTSRVYNLSFGGGSLLDVGVYCVSLFQMVLQRQPEKIEAHGRLGPSGVDEDLKWTFSYDDGAVTEGHSSIIQNTDQLAVITGTKGTIRIPKFWCPRSYTFNGENRQVDFEGQGLHFEAQEVTDCILQGKTESEVMTLSDSLAVMKTMDQIRTRLGLRYPENDFR